MAFIRPPVLQQVAWDANAYDDGRENEESLQYEHPATIGGTSQKTSSKPQQPSNQVEDSHEEMLPTAESVLPSKRTISNDKNKQSKKRTMRLSLTSVQDSILREKGCYGWWTKSCAETSQKLLLPIKIGSADLGSNSCSGFVKGVTQNSWSNTIRYVPQTKSSQKISWPTSMFSLSCRYNGRRRYQSSEDKTASDSNSSSDPEKLDEGSKRHLQFGSSSDQRKKSKA
jgi:hypothetical protein